MAYLPPETPQKLQLLQRLMFGTTNRDLQRIAAESLQVALLMPATKPAPAPEAAPPAATE
jgi:hypothetical protein